MTIGEKIANIFPESKDLPVQFKLSPILQKEYLIHGEIRSWNGPMQEVLSPVCLKEGNEVKQVVLGSYPMLSGEVALEALESSCKAYSNGLGHWPKMSVAERISHVQKFTMLMKQKRNEMVNILMWEIGKNLKDSEKEFDRTIEYIEDTINALKDLDRVSSRFVFEKGILAQIRRAPLGVVLCMGPFNYPLNETFTTLIPALIMGNTILFKPAKYGVLLWQPILAAFKDAFPAGVINTIYGDGAVVISPLMASGKIDVLAFIGSAKVANLIEKQHPRLNRLKTVYGLGAKNPAILLKDCDIDLAVKECILGSLSYNGQRCTALKILFVHKDIADTFLRKFCEELAKLKIGMPWEDNVQLTPLPEDKKSFWMDDFAQDAIQNGAKIINENGGLQNKTFYYPAVLYPVNDKCKLYHAEQFGPLVPVVPFSDIEEPIQYIVNSDVGQQASIFGKNEDQVSHLVDILVNQVCRVNLNSQCQRGPDTFPFTGRKDSAEGTLSVPDALRVFSIRTLVAAKDDETNKDIIRKIITKRNSKFLSTDFIL